MKLQFAARLKDVLDKDSFHRKDHCLKERQAVFRYFFIHSSAWATRTDVQLHTCRVFGSIC